MVCKELLERKKQLQRVRNILKAMKSIEMIHIFEPGEEQKLDTISNNFESIELYSAQKIPESTISFKAENEDIYKWINSNIHFTQNMILFLWCNRLWVKIKVIDEKLTAEELWNHNQDCCGFIVLTESMDEIVEFGCDSRDEYNYLFDKYKIKSHNTDSISINILKPYDQLIKSQKGQFKEFYVENKEKTMAAYCTKSGQIIVEKLNNDEILFGIDMFGKNYEEWRDEWLVALRFAFSPTNKILAVAYGIGWVYLVDIDKQCVCRHFRFFPEVNYEDSSFQEIDMCCYYNEYTRLDFSPSGKYIAVRVRGDFDPQESDGRSELFTPTYMRSVFVIDMDSYDKVFEYYYPDNTEKHYAENLAVFTFSTDEKVVLTGAPGGMLKMFDLKNGRELASFDDLEWIADSTGIDNRELAVFLDNSTFLYVSYIYKTNVTSLVKVERNKKGWHEVGRYEVKLTTKNDMVMDINYDKSSNKIVLELGIYSKEKRLVVDVNDI